MDLHFDTFGNEKQKQVCRFWNDNVTSDIVYGGSKGSGKSYLGVSLIFGDAFMYPDTAYFIARKSLTNIRKFTIPSIYEVFGHWGVDERYYKYNGQDNYFELYNKSKVYLLDAKYQPGDPLYYRFGSMQMTRGWIEEAGEFEESAKNNLSASIGRWNNMTNKWNLHPKLLQTCNPSKNYLYRDYYKKNQTGELEGWKKFIQALPADNKKLPPEYLINLERSLSENEKQRLLHGSWEYDDDPAALIDYDSILAIFKNVHVKAENNKYITCDVARYGRDKTVICVWYGWKVVKIAEYPKTSITQVAALIKEEQVKYGIATRNVIVDEDGVGGGVVDILKCVGFIANSSPIKKALKDLVPLGNGQTQKVEYYANLKSQCYFKFAERVVDRNTYIDCQLTNEQKDSIISELEQVKQKSMDSDGKRAIMSKDEVKELIGRSPDYSDALMMREYFELSAPVTLKVNRNFR